MYIYFKLRDWSERVARQRIGFGLRASVACHAFGKVRQRGELHALHDTGEDTWVGVGGVSRGQWSELESAEHLWTVYRLPPHALVSVEHAAVSAVSSGESSSRRSNFDTALLINASVDSVLAATTCVGVGVPRSLLEERLRLNEILICLLHVLLLLRLLLLL